MCKTRNTPPPEGDNTSPKLSYKFNDHLFKNIAGKGCFIPLWRGKTAEALSTHAVGGGPPLIFTQ